MMRWAWILLAVGAISSTPIERAAERADSTTAKPVIDRLRDNPASIPLDMRDPALDASALFRDCRDNPRRDAGPINVRRTEGGLAYQGVPTFFRAPIALCPEGLTAGRVDVAVMGALADQSFGTRGPAWGPRAVLTGIAMRRKGIADPHYVDTAWIDHGARPR